MKVVVTAGEAAEVKEKLIVFSPLSVLNFILPPPEYEIPAASVNTP